MLFLLGTISHSDFTNYWDTDDKSKNHNKKYGTVVHLFWSFWFLVYLDHFIRDQDKLFNMFERCILSAFLRQLSCLKVSGLFLEVILTLFILQILYDFLSGLLV